MLMNKILMALSAALTIAAIGAGPPSPPPVPSNDVQMERLRFLVGTWQCTTSFLTNGTPSRKQRTTTSTEMITQRGPHWLHGSVTTSVDSQSTGSSDVFFGYHAGRRQWVIMAIDPLGYSAVQTSDSVSVNGSTWMLVYPEKNDFRATMQTDSSREYVFDASWKSHKGNTIVSHEVCNKQ
jgi:hypothetical protein